MFPFTDFIQQLYESMELKLKKECSHCITIYWKITQSLQYKWTYVHHSHFQANLHLFLLGVHFNKQEKTKDTASAGSPTQTR